MRAAEFQLPWGKDPRSRVAYGVPYESLSLEKKMHTGSKVGLLSWMVVVGLTVSGLVLTGCSSSTPAPSGTQAGHDDHDHDHDHAHHDHHDHELGPNGGHILELAHGLHAEWLHDDETGKITFIILGEDAKTDAPIAAEKLTLDSTFEGTKRSFEIPAVGDAVDGKHARFESSNFELLAALTSAEKVDNVLMVPIEGETVKVTIEHHDHHHH